jgi:hypothetical protein
MSLLTIDTIVGPDGLVHVVVPDGFAKTNDTLRVTLEKANLSVRPDSESWQEFVDRVAGTWQGEWERPPQAYETRTAFS